MDEIPFEKVSVDDAKRALRGDAAKSEVRPAPQKDWGSSRNFLGPPPPPLI
jgi:hypothetical protein